MSFEEHEELPIVDENDIEVGSARRMEIHRRAWRHRAVHVLVVNSRGEVLLQRRSLMKDTYPGFWDISVGGHVGLDETYEEAAVRELEEELGVKADLKYQGKLEASAATGWEFVEVYACRHEGPFRPAAEEISELRWMRPSDALDRAALERAWPVTRSGLNTLRFYMKQAGGHGDTPEGNLGIL